MAQNQIVRGVATTTSRNGDGYTTVTYHKTEVVRFNGSKIILDTGGWRSATTKRRMNQASNHFGLGFRVFQKSGDWFVEYDGKVLPFANESISLERHANRTRPD